MIHIHLQDSKVDVNNIDTPIKHNNFNNLCFHISKDLLDNFNTNIFSESQCNTINEFMKEDIKKEDGKESLVLCYLHHRLHNILFNPGKNTLESDFSRIVGKTLETTNHSLYKQLKKIIQSTVARCQTEHGTKHGAENTILQTLKDLGYKEDQLNELPNNQLKLILKHHRLNQKIISLDIPLDISSSLQDKRNIIEKFQQTEQEKNEIQQGNKIIIKENKKKPKKPLLKREKIHLSKVDYYRDEDNE